MKTQTAAPRRSSSRACVVCTEAVNELAPCPSCPGPYHASCAPRATNCGALGCPAGSGAQEAGAPPGRGQVCPYCRDVFNGEAALICGGCQTRYHQECAADLGRCGTLGCRQQLEVRARDRGKVTHVRDTPVHPCTHCGDGVRADDANTCFHCGVPFHLECAFQARRCPCGGRLVMSEARRPLMLVWACALWSLGASVVVLATWPVVHPLTTRALLLAGAFGPVALGAAAYVYSSRRRPRRPTNVNRRLLLGSLALLLATAGLGLWVATQRPGPGGISAGFLGLCAFLLALRARVHPEIGTNWRADFWREATTPRHTRR